MKNQNQRPAIRPQYRLDNGKPVSLLRITDKQALALGHVTDRASLAPNFQGQVRLTRADLACVGVLACVFKVNPLYNLRATVNE